MPRLAAFPKAWLDDLCSGAMSLEAWLDIAATLGVEGIELYSGMCDLQDPSAWPRWRRAIEERGMSMPMLCHSPDFTQRNTARRRDEIARACLAIDLTAAFGGQFCRVLSGQRRPELSDAEGLDAAAEGILACLPHAAERGVTLVLENHYKDQFWTYPEFAQRMDVFCALVDRVDEKTWPNFGVNYDPSNALLAGDDPLELLRRVRSRVKTMHASDRYLTSGTLEDLRGDEARGESGYAARLAHGEVGRGLNDYDAICASLRDTGFDGWISIEDGLDGVPQLQRSVEFLRCTIAAYWPSSPAGGRTDHRDGTAAG